MRFASLLSALPLALALQAPLHAQVAKTADVRVVTINDAEVRSGASTSELFYVTNRLPHNARVEVIEEVAGGWLKIRPPEGSFSWINTRFLEHIVPNRPNYVVHVRGWCPGHHRQRHHHGHRPTVIGAKLQRGAQVIGIGQPLTDAEGTWMPIEAPAGESRYIRADAVSPRANDIQTVAHSTLTDGKSGALALLDRAQRQFGPFTDGALAAGDAGRTHWTNRRGRPTVGEGGRGHGHHQPRVFQTGPRSGLLFGQRPPQLRCRRGSPSPGRLLFGQRHAS